MPGAPRGGLLLRHRAEQQQLGELELGAALAPGAVLRLLRLLRLRLLRLQLLQLRLQLLQLLLLRAFALRRGQPLLRAA